MLKKKILIVGNGIIGHLLAFQLQKAFHDVTLIGKTNSNPASRISAGMLNPINGKKFGVLKDYNLKKTAALATYHELEQTLNQNIIKTISVYKFLAEHHVQINNPYVEYITETEVTYLKQYFNADESIIRISPCYQIQIGNLLDGLESYNNKNCKVLEATFEYEAISLEDNKVEYCGIRYDEVIFCEGAQVRNNPYWSHLKFTKNRGDVLHIHIPNLPNNSIYEMGFKIMPLKDQIFWVGSNNVWNYDNLEPNTQWSKEVTEQLKNKLKLDVEIVHHLVAERPTIAGQEPVYERHPVYEHMWIINGLGTRGYSAGPYIIQEFLKKLEA